MLSKKSTFTQWPEMFSRLAFSTQYRCFLSISRLRSPRANNANRTKANNKEVNWYYLEVFLAKIDTCMSVTIRRLSKIYLLLATSFNTASFFVNIVFFGGNFEILKKFRFSLWFSSNLISYECMKEISYNKLKPQFMKLC